MQSGIATLRGIIAHEAAQSFREALRPEGETVCRMRGPACVLLVCGLICVGS